MKIIRDVVSRTATIEVDNNELASLCAAVDSVIVEWNGMPPILRNMDMYADHLPVLQVVAQGFQDIGLPCSTPKGRTE